MPNLITTGNTLTMSSREIAELVGSRHDSVKRTMDTLSDKGLIAITQSVEPTIGGGKPATVYLVGKRDSYIVVAQLCPEFTARLVDRWQELEEAASVPSIPQSLPEALRLAADLAEQNVVLLASNQKQAEKIGAMENLFHEGMTIPQFCKGLNGVNVMQVCSFLERRNWLFNESKHSTRWRAASYARDRYLTEHQATITPHGSEPFTAFTPVLLKKGAIRLYDMYLNSELPMKKTWDGLFTHDKALRGAA